MTRNDILEHLKQSHGERLNQVGLLPVDTPEALFYVIDDALRSDDPLVEAEQRCEILIHDRAMALGVDVPVIENEVTENVSNE